jgi:hypothetical protein
MIRSVRKKLASSIAGLETVEDFSFNSWLRIPLQDVVEIGAISSHLKNTKKINLHLDIPESEKFVAVFPETNIYPELKNYFFKKVRSNAVFFKMNPAEQRGIHISEIESKSLKSKPKKFKFVVVPEVVKEIKVRLSDLEQISYPLLIQSPAIFDYLSEMVPEVRKIELLNLQEIVGSDESVEIINYQLLDDTNKIETKSVELNIFKKPKVKSLNIHQITKPNKIFKVKVPDMGSYKSTVSQVKFASFKLPTVKSKRIVHLHEAKVLTPEVKLHTVPPYKYFDINDSELTEAPAESIDSLKSPQIVKELVKLLLKKVQKVEWGKRKDLHVPLLKFEEEGAKFLAENDRALLLDEFGIDKEKQAVSAVKFLFGNRAVKSVLIVCSPGRMGDAPLSEKLSTPIGWIGKIQQIAPELSNIEVKGSDDERTDLWNKSSLVYLVSHATLLNDHHMKILDDKKLHSFDCVILDEVQMLLDKGEKAEKLLNSFKPGIFWALSSIISKELPASLNNQLNSSCKIENVKMRQKKDVALNAPDFTWHEDWLYLDEDQELEYKETLVDCQKDLRKILETGNPYRFQANIFTLLHKVKQVCNFSRVNSESPKIKLLLEQISIITQNKKKVIVFSQYDRMGIRKIEKALQSAGVKFVIAPNGYSVEEMEKALNLFKQKADLTVFLTDAKISKLKFGGFHVPYIIKFDQWWNPLSMWEIEDLFDFSHHTKKTESINVYSYQNYNTLDQDIKTLLARRDLYNKNIFEAMAVKVFDDLVTVDEWLQIFKMPVNDEHVQLLSLDTAISILKNCTLNYFRTVLSKFFFMLGYTSVDVIDEPGTSSFNLVGESKRNNTQFYLYARVFLDEIVSKKAVKDIMFDAADSTTSKIFIISKGVFEEGIEELALDKYILLDLKTFAEYLTRFNLINENDANIN